MSSLSWREADGVVVVSGRIDEKSDFNGLLAKLGDSTTLDLAGVEQINSTGVREWLRFVKAVGDKKLTLTRCSIPLVQQFNMIAGFLGTARVESIYAPYLCPECDTPALKLIDVKHAQQQVADAPKCASCGAATELDDLPQFFLGFLSR